MNGLGVDNRDVIQGSELFCSEPRFLPVKQIIGYPEGLKAGNEDERAGLAEITKNIFLL